MRDYNRNDRSQGARRGGGDFRGRESGRREMHSAVCDECGNNCEVPFKPSGGKPIYCSNCFERREGGSSRGPSRRDSGRSEKSDFGSRDNSNKQLLDGVNALNSKLERILNILEGADKKKVLKPAKVMNVEIKAKPKTEKVALKKTAKKETKKTTSKK